MTAVIEVAVREAASAMARPRSRTRTIAASAEKAPAAAPAAISPTECPASRSVLEKISGSTDQAVASAAATSSGWATAVSLMVASSEVVPWVTRSMSATADNHARWSEKVGSDIQSDRNPGFWAPWPGATIASTFPLCPLTGPEARHGTDEVPTVAFVGFSQRDRGVPPKSGVCLESGPIGGLPTSQHSGNDIIDGGVDAHLVTQSGNGSDLGGILAGATGKDVALE